MPQIVLDETDGHAFPDQMGRMTMPKGVHTRLLLDARFPASASRKAISTLPSLIGWVAVFMHCSSLRLDQRQPRPRLGKSSSGCRWNAQ
ncbi:MAG TPA: hypothetical protein VIT23_01240 [Terrimicrobiaceae bacterium]